MESGNLFFELPENTSYVDYGGMYAALVDTIPTTWKNVSGELYAPSTLKQRGLVTPHTGVRFMGAHMSVSAHIAISCKWEKNQSTLRPADFLGILSEGKRPAYLEFRDTGDRGPITLEEAQTIIKRFLTDGYRGHLIFSNVGDIYSPYHFPCEMSFKRWKGYSRGDGDGEHPARVKLNWGGDTKVTREDVDPIVQLCRTMNLREYVPPERMKTVAA
jgi:hypothetical protein